MGKGCVRLRIMLSYLKFSYYSDNICYNFFFLTKYYTIFIKSIMPKFITGILMKSSSLYIYLNSIYLFLVLTFFKFNSVAKLDSLLDIVVVDFPTNIKKRFQVIYSFWNYTYKYRIFINFFISSFDSILSISSFYKSLLGWREKFEICLV